MLKKIRIEFDPFNREAIQRLLEIQQSSGYRLKEISEFTGTMTFETTYETVRYAIRQKKLYKNDCPEVEGWISKGDVGPFRIFSTTDSSIADYPLEEFPEQEAQKKDRPLNILNLLIYLLLGGLTIWSFTSEYFASTAALFEMQLTDILEPVFLVISVFIILHNILAKKKPRKPMRNPSWFKSYVLPWILVPLYLVLTFAGMALLFHLEDNHPATEVPFDAPPEDATAIYTLMGQIISADGEFLYIAHNEKNAQALYEEALTAYDDNKGRWCRMYSFMHFNSLEELSTEAYRSIDKAMLLDEKSDFYNLKTKGIIVLTGNRLYGITFDKEATTAEEVLAKLDAKLHQTDY